MLPAGANQGGSGAPRVSGAHSARPGSSAIGAVPHSSPATVRGCCNGDSCHGVVGLRPGRLYSAELRVVSIGDRGAVIRVSRCPESPPLDITWRRRPVAQIIRKRESAMLSSLALRDLSAAVLDALAAGLPNEGLPLVDHVEVSANRGCTHLVSVCSGIRRDQVGNRLEETILRIVGRVMAGRRHVVQIIWATQG